MSQFSEVQSHWSPPQQRYPCPPFQPSPKKKSHPWIRALAGLFFAAVVFVPLIVAASKPVQPSAAPGATVAKSPKAALISAWSRQYADHLTAISTDLTNMQTDSQDLLLMREHCNRLGLDAATAAADPAVPDTIAAARVAAALAYFQMAAKDCVVAIDTSSPALMQDAMDEIASGGNDMNLATAAIGVALDGR